MTRRHIKPAPRKSTKEWARLVRAWKRSGKTSAAFAASRGILATTLVWWAWRLGKSGTASRPASPPKTPPRLKLVEVAVDRPTALSCSSWELRTAAGVHLTVHGELSVAALALVIGAKGSRP